MYRKILVFVMFITVLSIVPVTVRANPQNMSIRVSIQDYEKILASDVVHAYTFEEAVRKLANSANIEIVTSRNEQKTWIYSVNGVKNKTFGEADGWLGCIVRRGQVIKPENFMMAMLERGDELVLYYGDLYGTKIIDRFEFNVIGDTAEFRTRSRYVKWNEKNGAWSKEDLLLNLSDVKIHLFMPDGTHKIIKTDEDGLAYTKFDEIGVYRYYAEGYSYDKVPSVVHTKDYYCIYGVADENRITRGEAAAIIVKFFKLKDADGYLLISDVNGSTPYAAEIRAAVAAGIMQCDGGGRVQPDKPVSLLELAVMLGRLLPEDAPKAGVPGSVPEWARKEVGAVLAAYYLNVLNFDWNQNVSVNMLHQIYAN